jgi:hypothetical protein
MLVEDSAELLARIYHFNKETSSWLNALTEDDSCIVVAALKHTVQNYWRSIESVPLDVLLYTCGIFRPSYSESEIYIVHKDDYISSNTPFTVWSTGYMHNGMHGKYERTHWMPLPQPPKENES